MDGDECRYVEARAESGGVDKPGRVWHGGEGCIQKFIWGQKASDTRRSASGQYAIFSISSVAVGPSKCEDELDSIRF